MKRILIFLIVIALIIGGFTYLIKNNLFKIGNNKAKITTSFYPYYFFAKRIGGDVFEITNITPPGAEPHDYEPTPKDIIGIESSKLLIVNGISEPWLPKIKSFLQNSSLNLLEAGKTQMTGNDPHTWLSIRLAKEQIGLILNKLIEISPSNKVYFTNNANKLINDLTNLDNEYKSGLMQCKTQDIVTSHAAFAYLAQDYKLNQIAIAGLSPDSEPSLKQLGEIANLAKTNGIKYIFFESLVSPKLADTIASEIGAQTLVLNPLEGLTQTEIAKGEDYITIMRENLKNLKIALQCQ